MATSRSDTIVTAIVIDYQVAPGQRPPLRPIAFPRRAALALTSSAVAVSEGEEFRIEVYGATGTRLRSIRVSRPLARATDADRKAFLEERQGAGGDPVFADVLPGYTALRYDAVGRLWAELYRPARTTTRRYDVFDTEGRLIAVVETAQEFRIEAVDATRIYGIHRDELDVQRIEAYELPPALRAR
jgi:hypothetical protein